MTIAVVIPSYNGGRYLEHSILSALNQQRRPDEIIVSDDNSTDDTLAICRRYQPHITVYRNSGGPSGFVNAWNTAIGKAKSDYISILHQDDLLAPEFIRMAAAALESNPAVRHLFSTCRYIDEGGRTLSLSYPCDTSASGLVVKLSGLEYVKAYQEQGYPHIHRCPGVITHRSIFETCRYAPEAGHIADDDFFYRVGQYTSVIGILQPMAAFRLHSGSVTGRMEDAALVRQLMEDYLYQCRQWKDNDFLDKAAYGYFMRNASRYIRRWVGYGLRRGDMRMVLKGFRNWGELYG
jgi:glycosyltransferase involved in cell wall biosynthesis